MAPQNNANSVFQMPGLYIQKAEWRWERAWKRKVPGKNTGVMPGNESVLGYGGDAQEEDF